MIHLCYIVITYKILYNINYIFILYNINYIVILITIKTKTKLEIA